MTDTNSLRERALEALDSLRIAEAPGSRAATIRAAIEALPTEEDLKELWAAFHACQLEEWSGPYIVFRDHLRRLSGQQKASTEGPSEKEPTT